MSCMMGSGLQEPALRRSWHCLVALLTPKDGDKCSLTLSGLPKHLMALFSSSGRCSFDEMFLCPEVLPEGRILPSKLQTLTSSTVKIISLASFIKDLTITASVVT